jgi:hypothetical protein
MAEKTSAQNALEGAAKRTVEEKTKIDDVHDAIIDESYGDGNHCDILGKYCWTIDAVRNSDNNDIPFCRLVEYKQIHNSVITNLINSISAARTSVEKLGENNEDILNKGFDKVKEISKAMVSAAAGELKAVSETEEGEVAVSFGKGLMSALGKGWEMIQSSVDA